MNIAASIQKVTQDILLKILLSLKKEFKEDNKKLWFKQDYTSDTNHTIPHRYFVQS